MKAIVADTQRQYTEMYNLPEEQRLAYFLNEIMKPFEAMFQTMHMPIEPQALSCLSLSAPASRASTMLDSLAKANAWAKAEAAMTKAAVAFENAGIPLPETVHVGIFLGDPAMLAKSEGYTGMGSIPGYVLIIIDPNETNLAKLQACVAHELHHNVLFHNADWNFMTDVTVARYIGIEGLAESFAAHLYGKNSVGPWVTNISEDDLLKAREMITGNLNVTGFMEVRKYLYGDHPMIPQSEHIGMPYCGGYAVGYHAVQAFLKKTGISIEKATIMDGGDIMELSGYFA